jgi:hypothetical protein
MIVKLKTNLGSNDFPDMPFLEGEEHEVSEAAGQKLVRLKLADDVTPPPKPVVAKPEPEAPKATTPPAKTSKHSK